MKTRTLSAHTLVVVAGAAVAQMDAPKIDFAAVDSNGDGRLTKEETRIVADLAAAFEQLDADKDNSISRAEYQRWERAGKVNDVPRDPATAPSGSAGAQHVPDPGK